MTTLEKIKRLEQYLAIDSSAIDPVLQMAIDKLIAREIGRVRELTKHLAVQLAEFEEHYALKSADFNTRYENGEMGDSMDFVEWSSTIELLANADKKMALLETESGQ
jgi:hypothetical protein